MNDWIEYKLDDVALINPVESLLKGSIAKKVAMEVLQPFTKRISSYALMPFNGGMKFRNGDVIVARITPSLENGKTAFIDFLEDNEIGFGSTEFIVLRERKEISDRHFLYYFSISPEFREVAILSMTGSSGRQRVQTDVVRKHAFFLPSLPEQKAIAGVLSSLDDKIDLLQRQNKTLEAMAETLFRQWFVEEAQESWEEGTLSDLAIFSNGKTRPIEVEGGNIPIYGGNGILGFTDRSNYNGRLIIIGRVGAYCGSLYFENKAVWISDNALVAKAVDIKNIGYLYFLLKFMKINEMAEGSSHPLITQTLLNSIPVLLPPYKLLNAYSLQVDGFLEKIDFNTMQIKKLEKLRDTLLPKLMSGEVRIKVN